MLFKEGEKIHVITRRYFEMDIRRHFVGEVKAVGENAVRAEGYVFVWDKTKNQFIRRPNWRDRIVALSDGGNIINVVPENVILEEISYRMTEENRLVVTDGKSFRLDVNEFGGKW